VASIFNVCAELMIHYFNKTLQSQGHPTSRVPEMTGITYAVLAACRKADANFALSSVLVLVPMPPSYVCVYFCSLPLSTSDMFQKGIRITGRTGQNKLKVGLQSDSNRTDRTFACCC
jgi:hypothetical protein